MNLTKKQKQLLEFMSTRPNDGLVHFGRGRWTTAATLQRFGKFQCQWWGTRTVWSLILSGHLRAALSNANLHRKVLTLNPNKTPCNHTNS